MLDILPGLVSEEEKSCIGRLPERDEVKKVVFELNGDSVASSDGFSGMFFQKCWDIIRDDVTRAMRAFFYRQELPRYINYTNLVIIPKKEVPRSFINLRPTT